MHYKRALLPLIIGYLFIYLLKKKIVKIVFVVKPWAPQVAVLSHDLGSMGAAKG